MNVLEIEQKILLSIYHDVAKQYLGSWKHNKPDLFLTGCEDKDFFGVLEELKKRYRKKIRWGKSPSPPSERRNKHLRLYWTEDRISPYNSKQVYQVDIHYMKERELKRGDWIKEFEERGKKNNSFFYRMVYTNRGAIPKISNLELSPEYPNSLQTIQ